jgi:hypothetical protein
MTDKLEMPLEQFAGAVAKENARLNEHNEKLKEQTKLYFHAFNKATNHIEKLEALLRMIIDWDNTLEFEDGPSWGEVMEAASKALEGNPEKSVYKEGYRAVEEAMGHPSPEFWVGDRND